MHVSKIAPAFLLASRIQAWGELGHRAVGYLAEKDFTPQAQAWVTAILGTGEGRDISDVAVWADYIKRQRKYSAPWHYIDAQDDPPNSCGVNYDRDCDVGEGCIVSALRNQTAIILDPSSPAQLVADALSYTIHFLGDIHQPLHTENLDRGGNGIKVRFGGHNMNLHSVWDTGIPCRLRSLDPSHEDRYSGDELREAAAGWAEDLHASLQARHGNGNGNGSSSGSAGGECVDVHDPVTCALQWAGEANAWVCSFVMARPLDWLENNDLAADYYDGAAPIVQDLIGKAGQRLAAWVNALANEVAGQGLVRQPELK